MEEKRFDPYQFIGFILIALILTWMLYENPPEEDVNSTTPSTATESVADPRPEQPLNQMSDSLQQINLQNAFGIFTNWMTDQGATTQKIENQDLLIEVTPKGGILTLVRLKEYTDYLDQPLDLIKAGNNTFNVQFTTKDGRRLNTKDFYLKVSIDSVEFPKF